MNYIIISGYTYNTIYEKEIKDLESDLKRFNLPYKLYGYTDRGEWTKNTMVKAELFQKAMNEFPNRDIIWLDADSVILHEPIFFKELINKDFDICCYYYDKRKDGKRYKELLSGTIIFRNNNLMQNVVDNWVNDTSGVEWDQRILQKYVDGKYHDKLKKLDLPNQYIKIRGGGENPRTLKNSIVVHKQLSRLWRNK